MLFILIVIIIAISYLLNAEEINFHGGRRQPSCMVSDRKVTVIGPRLFYFYKRSANLPQLLLFGEQHDDTKPGCRGINVITFIKNYIKRYPSTHVYLEKGYDIYPGCGDNEGDTPSLAWKIYKLIKTDKKHFFATDNRSITPLCAFDVLLDEIKTDKDREEVNQIKDFIEENYLRNSFKTTMKVIIEDVTGTKSFKKRFSKLNMINKARINILLKWLLNPRDNFNSSKYFKKKMNKYEIYDFLLRTTTLLCDIEVMMWILLSFQNFPNRHIIVYYGSNHIEDLRYFILKLIKMTPTISTTKNTKNCISIPHISAF